MLLEVENIAKKFGSHTVLEDLNFSISEGETLSILGKSGCGKTTLLKIIAGLEEADQGSILLKKQLINKWKANKRGIVYLYQEDLLFPHLNVFENIAFGLHIKKLAKSDIHKQVSEMMRQLEIEEHATKMPSELSGGQRQRVSFGRALIINPSVLLLDEPFGSLDSGTRKNMQELFKEVSARFKITSVFVTHDLKEALLMGDEIGLMDQGHLKTYASAQEFMKDPASGVASELSFWEDLKNRTTKKIIENE